MKKICSMMIPLSLGIYLSSTTSLNAAIQWLPDALEKGLKFSGNSFPSGGFGGGHNLCDNKFTLTKCPSNGSCDKCAFAEKYYLKGCKTGYKFDSTGTACTEDCSGYTLSYCPTGAQSCPSCGGKYKLVSCKSGYTKSGNQCLQNCASYYNLDSCPTHATCSSCGGKYTISYCEGVYTERNNQCVCPSTYSLASCPELAQSCSSCDGKYKIDSCKSGYSENDNQCVEDEVCSSLYSLSECPAHGTCTSCGGKFYFSGCDEGFHKEGSKCAEGCESYYNLDTCPDHATCSSCGGKYTISYCTGVYTESNNQCVCPSTYSLNACPEHALSCSSCDGKYKVSRCESGYTNSNNQCVKQACSSIYNLDACPAHGSCTSCDDKFKLSSCESGYKKSGDQCEEDCASGYSLTSCPAHAECLSCGGKFKFDGCEDGYKKVLSKNECECSSAFNLDACPDNGQCSSCGGKFMMTKCDEGYRKIGSSCSGILKILYSDKTTSYDIISGKTPIGIVLDEKRKLAVALKRSTVNRMEEPPNPGDSISALYWSDEYFDIPDLPNLPEEEALKDFNGKSNTAKISAYCKSNNKSCPAIEFAISYETEGTKAGDWYVPALGEVNLLHDLLDAHDRTLKTIHNEVDSSYHMGIGLAQIWSSNEISDKKARTIYFGAKEFVYEADKDAHVRGTMEWPTVEIIPFITY